MFRKLLSLLLSLSLLPALLAPALAEEDGDLLIEEVTEEVMLDENGNEVLVDEETGESFILSATQQEELEAMGRRHSAV